MDYLVTRYKNTRKKLEDKGLLNRQTAGLVLVGFVALSVFWSGAKIIKQNYDLTLKVEKIQQENSILDLENKNKELQNQYLASDEFADITARRVFGKAAAGERVYIVPKETALSSLSSSESVTEVDEIIGENLKPKYQQNLEAWFRLYFGS